jgi:hypothetical protein
MRDQVAFAREQTAHPHPLFPAPDQRCPSKSAVIATIVEAAKRLRLPLRSTTGAPAWGGHALRRGGAQHLAASGIDVWRAQALARHSSDAILRYLDGMHARNLGNITADAALGRSVAQLRSQVKAIQASVKRKDAPRHTVSAQPNLQYIVSFDSKGRTHLVHPRSSSRTMCNWSWDASKAQLAEVAGPARMCIKCTTRTLLAQEGQEEAATRGPSPVKRRPSTPSSCSSLS